MSESDLATRLQQALSGHAPLGDLLGVDAPRLDLLTELGHLFFQEGRYGEARILFEGILALDPARPYTWRALGAVHTRLGQLERAAHYYQQAVKVEPANPEAWANLGEVLWHQGQTEQAQNCLTRAEELFRRLEPDAPLRRRAAALLSVVRTGT